MLQIGAGLGCALGAMVIIYGFLVTETDMPALNESLVLTVCPPSIALLAVEHARWYTVALIDSIVIFFNAAWYVCIFGALGILFRTRPQKILMRPYRNADLQRMI